MTYNFDKPVNRENTNCVKYDHREEVFGNPDVIPLWVADSDFEVAPFIKKALEERLSKPVFGYTFRAESFNNAVIGWVKRRNNWEIKPEWIDFVPGVVTGLIFAMRTFTNEGDGVVIQPPVYPPFARLTKFNRRKVLNNPLVWNGEKFVIDFEDLDKKLSRAKVFLLCNPHNPTGRVYTEEELRLIGELCIKHNVLIISDEIHSDLVDKPYHHIHLASLSDEIARQTITLIAPSKTFNVAGFSTSLAITSDEETRKKLRNYIEQFNVSQGNVFGTVALEAAYNGGDLWVDELNEYLFANADFVVDFLKNNIPSIKTYKPEGTFLMWLDFREWNIPHDQLFRLLVDKAGVGFNDGKHFGEEGIGFMRLNLATRREVIAEALEKIKLLALEIL